MSQTNQTLLFKSIKTIRHHFSFH